MKRVVNNFPEAVRKDLARHLKERVPFDQAWEIAMFYLEPRERGWKLSVGGDSKPIDFLRRVMKKEYELVLHCRANGIPVPPPKTIPLSTGAVMLDERMAA